MSIIFVSGPACAGKSTYIKNNFPKHKVIDLWDFQKDLGIISIDAVWKSYIECQKALVEAIKNEENVVLEHTLLRAKRRKIYVDAIREVSNKDIEIHFLLPEKEEYRKRMKERGIVSEYELNSNLEIAEIPTKEEGFSKVVLVKN